MSATIAKANYPEFSGEIIGQSAKRRMLYVNYGYGSSKENPIWNRVGGTDNAAFNVKADVTSVNTKDSGMWASGFITGKSAELTASVVYQEGDTAQAVIENFLLNDEISNEKKALEFALVDLDSKEYIRVVAIPTAWNMSANGGDMVTKDLTATVVGAPVQCTGWQDPVINTVEPDSASFDKDAPADVVFTVALGDTGVTVTGIKNGDSDLTSSDYTVSGNTVTIKKEYLATLDNGAAALRINCSAGNYLPVTVTVTGSGE